MIRYLTAQELLVIHALIIEETGGAHGVRDVGPLESIPHRPQSMADGTEMYPDIFKKAAVLGEAILNYHVFVDGNKRTGLAAAARFLHVNGYELVAGDEDTQETVLKVATKSLDIDEFALWLKDNARTR